MIDVCVLAGDDVNPKRKSVRALLDTGAIVSAVDSASIRELECLTGDTDANENRVKSTLNRIKINKTHIRGAFYQKGIQVEKMVQLTIELRDNRNIVKKIVHEFFEIGSLFVPMILGADFLSKQRLLVGCGDSIVVAADSVKIEEPIPIPEIDPPPSRAIETPEILNAQQRKVKQVENATLIPMIKTNVSIAASRANTDNEKFVSSRVSDGDTVSPDFASKLDDLLKQNRELLDGTFRKVRDYEHVIRMVNTKPYKGHTYPIPHKYHEEVKSQIDEMERIGVIRRAAKQYISPLVAIKKPNSKIRICLDARMVNDRMESDHAQPPTIDEVLAGVGRKRIFSKLGIT